MRRSKIISVGDFHISFWFDTDGFWDEVKWDKDKTIKAYHWLSVVTRKKKSLHTDDVYTMLSFVIYPFSINLFIKNKTL